ncbi:hypothetical protein ACHAXM_011897 [Skeletonema potamos]|jgi:hypothetical protein
MGDQVVAFKDLNEFKHPRDVSNTFLAFATAGINHPQSFEYVEITLLDFTAWINSNRAQALTDTV